MKVTNGEEEMEVASVELKKDGYMYIFMANEIAEDESANIKVSFTPDADCPLIYTTDQRPSMDVTSEMKVLPFTSEAIYYDETIEEMSYLMEARYTCHLCRKTIASSWIPLHSMKSV